MSSPRPRLVMLGTGSALPRRSYNTCFVLDPGTGQRLLVDAGGGNGILHQLTQCGLNPADIGSMFISHAHTDHILGAVWIVRLAIFAFKEGRAGWPLHVYGNAATIGALTEICRLTFLPSYFADMPSAVVLHTVSHGSTCTVSGMDMRFFDCHSREVDQTGFRTQLPTGESLCFLGDESLTEHNSADVAGADWLICGAFCRRADAHIFHPYEKHHHTVADVAATASDAAVKHLVLVHCEDTDPDRREALYQAEAGALFDGNVSVPTDGAIIEL